METIFYVQFRLDGDVWEDLYWNGKNYETADKENPTTFYHDKRVAMDGIKKDVLFLNKDCSDVAELTEYRIIRKTSYTAIPATEILKEA